MNLPPAVALVTLALAAGCTRSEACAPETDLAAIEARFHAELAASCSAFMPADPPSECPAYADIRDRARRARERWAACQR